MTSITLMNRKPTGGSKRSGRRSRCLDTSAQGRQRPADMALAELQKNTVCCISQADAAVDFTRIAAATSGPPRTIDPVTFADLVKKIGKERADLLRRLAE